MKFTQYLAGVFLGSCFIAPSLADPVQTIGWIEQVQIPAKDITFTAKIDTGADNSSIHASDVEIYEQNGDKRVKFSVQNKEGATSLFDLPLVRIAHIKRKRAEPIQRPVVSMLLCVGNTMKATLVNLANRKNFKYRMLIGRSFLKDDYLVNSGEKLTTKPTCSTENLATNEKI